ncbi:unnamed protein product [Cuscuta campestris]|uniref:Integrase catalytic domain-containing protein n=1 Tax=Cuscuta campestris TaxID=132261 RepID=A0A484N611_9ASTE|nr:unnamed protein product [Cuscuta campestris]
MDEKTAMSLLVSGLRSGELYKEFCRRPPQSYQEVYNTAWDYADAEAQVSSKREAEQGHLRGRTTIKREVELPGRVKAEVMEVKPEVEKKPTGENQWTEKYCSFHKTDSHNTTECNSVKGVIKHMIEAGELDQEYLAQARQKKNQWVRPEGQSADQNKKKKAAGKEHVKMIYGGPEGGDSASQRKKWGRELYVDSFAFDPRQKQTKREPIIFTDQDLPITGEDHNDPLVITMDMGGVDISRVLVETGSSDNVLYLEAFEKLKLCRTRLEPLKTPLSRFTGDSVKAEGTILITCELGTGDKVMQKEMSFVVVNIKCVHNAILGRPGINKVRGIISMAHLCMKFYTPGGIGQVRGDQKKARSLYLEAVKKTTKAFERVTLGQALAGFLVRLTGLEPEVGPSHTVEPWWDMAVDGASGPKGCGTGIVFTTPEGFKIYHALVFNFKLTNNEAEYEALAGGLRLARALDMLSKLMQACPEHVSNLAKTEILDLPSADWLEVAAVQRGQSSPVGVIEADDEWRYDLVEYLMTGQKPDDEERARKVVLRAPRFHVLDGHLYKRAIVGPLLRYLTDPEVEWVIAEFRHPRFTAYLANFGIKHYKASVAYPQGNGQVENANRTIVDGRKKRRATGETPFVLTYGCEARLPIEAEFPIFREAVYQVGQNEVDHMAELNLVEERRTMAAIKMARYQQSVKRYHDNWVGPHYFQAHDEVLRRRDASKPNERGKLVRNWEGPYRIKAIIRPGTYQLETMEGGRVDRHSNSHHLRKFYR